MANTAAMNEIRSVRKIEQLKQNAAQAPVKSPGIFRGAWTMPVALAFMALLVAVGLGGIGAPVAAADLNLSWVVEMFESIFSAATDAMPAFEGFIDAGFPLLIKIAIYGMIIGVLALATWFARGLVIGIINMIFGAFQAGKGKMN